jgi:hypothetical protein
VHFTLQRPSVPTHAGISFSGLRGRSERVSIQTRLWPGWFRHRFTGASIRDDRSNRSILQRLFLLRTPRAEAGVALETRAAPHSALRPEEEVMVANDILAALDIDLANWKGDGLVARSPRDGATLATLAVDTPAAAERKIDAAHAAFLKWRTVPAPQRGELVRVFGNVLREHKQALGRLVTLEAGKIQSEGLGEVQEMIDICDFAVGLSRQLYGLTIASERPGHRMME